MAEGEAQAGYIAELVVQIYNIHKVVIEESGGLEGLRDGAMLPLLLVPLPRLPVKICILAILRKRLRSFTP